MWCTHITPFDRLGPASTSVLDLLSPQHNGCYGLNKAAYSPCSRWTRAAQSARCKPVHLLRALPQGLQQGLWQPALATARSSSMPSYLFHPFLILTLCVVCVVFLACCCFILQEQKSKEVGNAYKSDFSAWHAAQQQMQLPVVVSTGSGQLQMSDSALHTSDANQQ